MKRDKYFKGDGIAFGAKTRYYKWIIPFVMGRDDFNFEEVDKDEYLVGSRMGVKVEDNEPPFKPGERVILHNNFRKGIGGKEVIIEKCWKALTACSSGWWITIDLYKRKIDSSWVRRPTRGV